MKLTKPQRNFLQKVAAYCLRDNSGQAYEAWGSGLRVASGLSRKGLVSLGAGWPVKSDVRITEAGRKALEQAEKCE